MSDCVGWRDRGHARDLRGRGRPGDKPYWPCRGPREKEESTSGRGQLTTGRDWSAKAPELVTETIAG